MDNIKTHDELVEIITNNNELINTAFTENKGVVLDNIYTVLKADDNTYFIKYYTQEGIVINNVINL
jgi:hypothetical protein